MTVAAGRSLVCDYDASLPDAATRTNTATATLTEIGTSFSGLAEVNFDNATINEVDEMVDVSDSFGGDLGSVRYSEVPKTFSYSRLVETDSAFCGSITIDNTATFTTNDTSTTGSDDANVIIDVPCQGCTPGFWQGGAGSQLWDEVDDPQWIYGGENPYIHTTRFNDRFSDITDTRLDGQTMFQIVSNDGGIANSAEKAARDMVAAYLNESAFPGAFPASSLADLEVAWYAAVAGGDAGLDAFHTLVGGWNDSGYCPLP
jgi:hypothetical protein